MQCILLKFYNFKIRELLLPVRVLRCFPEIVVGRVVEHLAGFGKPGAVAGAVPAVLLPVIFQGAA